MNAIQEPCPNCAKRAVYSDGREWGCQLCGSSGDVVMGALVLRVRQTMKVADYGTNRAARRQQKFLRPRRH